MIVISVVRDFNMYSRCIKENKFLNDAKLVICDNTKENKTVTKRYNEFLNSYDYTNDDWFVFCHEDWQVQEKLSKRLQNLDTNCIYGPIGVGYNSLYKIKGYIGQIKNSDKEGNNPTLNGKKYPDNTEIGTLDCQCMIVHSSLIKKHNLRFDENLTFDLYTEDFNIFARENFKISTKLLQLKCHHYSYGVIAQRYYNQLKYLQNKYSKAKNIYSTTCSLHNEIIGNSKTKRILANILFKLFKISQLFYQKKNTKSNHIIIKILKIPVYHKEIK